MRITSKMCAIDQDLIARAYKVLKSGPNRLKEASIQISTLESKLLKRQRRPENVQACIYRKCVSIIKCINL